MTYDNSGKVSLWKSQSDNEKAPILKGTVYAHRDVRQGEAIDIALWKNQSDNPKAPTLTGKLSDKQEKPAMASGNDFGGTPF